MNDTLVVYVESKNKKKEGISLKKLIKKTENQSLIELYAGGFIDCCNGNTNSGNNGGNGNGNGNNNGNGNGNG